MAISAEQESNVTRQYRILAVDGSGAVGLELSKQLSDDGHSVRATASKKVTQKAGGKVEQVHVDLLTGEGMTNAFEGIDRAFLMEPAAYPAWDSGSSLVCGLRIGSLVAAGEGMAKIAGDPAYHEMKKRYQQLQQSKS
jgi:hypothetical protein